MVTQYSKYNKNNILLEFEEYHNGKLVLLENYNLKGNIIYSHNYSTNYWKRLKYNKNNLLIMVVDSDKIISKGYYDDKNRLIKISDNQGYSYYYKFENPKFPNLPSSRIDSNEFTETYLYDDNGDIITF